MHRDKFTAKLVRIIASIESGNLPMDVRELYVFGSYSRGAIEPGDLDLIIVHGPGRQEIDKRVDEALQKSHPDILARVRAAAGKQNAARMRLFRKQGEAVQIIFAQSVAEVTGKESRIKPTDPILMWSNDDRQWREKIASIASDVSAGRAERNHLVEL
jgi:predicted nucleotidyltransferase